VDFEWDPRKAETNSAKHRIEFADAVTVFQDELSLTIRDPGSMDEDRWITLGVDALGRLLVVVYTFRNDAIRIISARPATPRETSQYEEKR
jgi:uncharacterized protein